MATQTLTFEQEIGGVTVRISLPVQIEVVAPDAGGDPPAPVPGGSPTAAQYNLAAGPGLNIGDTYEGGGTSLQPGDMAAIRAKGFRHVRIPVAAQNHEGDENFLQQVDWAIGEALAAGLLVTIDPLHHYGALMGDPGGQRDRALRITRTLAQRWAGLPAAKVAWEIVNEANGKLVGEALSAFLRDAASAIRGPAPDRILIVGDAMDSATPGWAGPFNPPVDERVILKVHSYDGGTAGNSDTNFTHQGEAWAGKAGVLNVPWPGSEQQKGALRGHFDKAAAFAQAKGIKAITLNEWGCVARAPAADYERFLTFMRQDAERRGWSWCYWNFATPNFGICPRGKGWNQGALRGLGLA